MHSGDPWFPFQGRGVVHRGNVDECLKGVTKDWFDSQWPLWQTAFTVQHSLMSIRADDLPYHLRGSFITAWGRFAWRAAASGGDSGPSLSFFFLFFFLLNSPLRNQSEWLRSHFSNRVPSRLRSLPDARGTFLCHRFLLSWHKFQQIYAREGTLYSISHESSLHGVMSPRYGIPRTRPWQLIS